MFGIAKGLFEVATDVVKVVTAPVEIGIDVVKVITKPLADIAEEAKDILK